MEFGGYAYRDRYGIIHVTKDRETAKKYAVGKVVEYPGPHSGGYPVAFEDELEGQMIIYTDKLKYKGREYPEWTWPAEASGTRKLLKQLGLL